MKKSTGFSFHLAKKLGLHSIENGERREARSRFLLWLPVITVGAFLLRMRYLGTQIVSGDELHLLVVFTTHRFLEIPGTVTGFDYCVPLALLFRAISGWIPLTEMMLRMPMLICGCLTPALAALVFRRFVSANTALTVALAIAAHPLFIFYSRFIRPYAICLALLLIVLFFLDRWLFERRPRHLVRAVMVSGLAGWFQPIALITLGLIFAGLLLHEWSILGRRDSEARVAAHPMAIIVSGLSALLLTLLLLSPSLAEFYRRMVMEKVGAGSLTAEVLEVNAEALTGFPGRTSIFLFLALILVGAIVLAKRLKRRSLPLLVPLFGQPIVIVLLKPSLLNLPLVLARYQFYVLPIAVLAACTAPAAIGIWGGRALFRRRFSPFTLKRLGIVCAFAATLAWIFWGPYFSIYTKNRAYAHHYLYQTFQYSRNPYWLAAHNHSGKIPLHPYYNEIYRSRKSIPLVLEWPPAMDYTKMTYHVAQAYYERPLNIIAQPGEPWWLHGRLNLQNVIDFFDPDSPPTLETGTVIILHKNPQEEMIRYALGSAPKIEPSSHHVALYELIFGQLQTMLGSPTFQDRYLTIFKIK